MQETLKKYTLQQDPKPFVKTQGWFLRDILMDLSEAEEKQVILYSRDGLKTAFDLSFTFVREQFWKRQLNGITI